MRSLDLARHAGEGDLPAPHAAAPPYHAEAYGLPTARVYWLGGGYRFELAETYWLAIDDWAIEVPASFFFNAASVPRLAWAAISPLDLGIISVLVHDWTYAGRPVKGMSRGDSDKLFRKLMKMEGVSWWKRHVAYAAVRAFGGDRWEDDS